MQKKFDQQENFNEDNIAVISELEHDDTKFRSKV